MRTSYRISGRSSAVFTASPTGASYIDIPLIGSAKFVTSVAAQPAMVPSTIVLHQNYPNPFNPSTTIRFDLATSGEVRLEVYTVTGQRIATLVDGIMPPGTHAIPFQARDIASGVYYYRLTTHVGSSVRSMVLLQWEETGRGCAARHPQIGGRYACLCRGGACSAPEQSHHGFGCGRGMRCLCRGGACTAPTSWNPLAMQRPLIAATPRLR
ncbi:MAG: T9SS type A sorting domain-containing protein [Ignavibacteriae bacterium]|nr:T9SS type A sorting domain-containing protein [Ignavibacteriota bacterium]